MGNIQLNWQKVSMLTKFLYMKLLAWGSARLYDLKKPRFLESCLIDISYL